MRGVLIASFGTTVTDKLESTLGAVEKQAAAKWPEVPIYRAFTSGMVRRKLAKSGVMVEDVPTTLRRMVVEGITRAEVKNTFVMAGLEYARLAEDCRQSAPLFQTLELSPPLLDHPDDVTAVARLVLERHPGLPDDTVLVLMGHGTGHRGDFAYSALDCAFRDMGRDNVFVATVEGCAGLDSLRRRLKRCAPRRVVLRPFLMTVGDHAGNDMAGEGESSWKSILAGDGYRVECVLEGLTEIPGIREYVLNR